MMAACDMVIMTLEGGPMGGQLVCVTSPAPRVRILLEDPDEGRSVHIHACCAASFRCHRGNTHFKRSLCEGCTCIIP